MEPFGREEIKLGKRKGGEKEGRRRTMEDKGKGRGKRRDEKDWREEKGRES